MQQIGAGPNPATLRKTNKRLAESTSSKKCERPLTKSAYGSSQPLPAFLRLLSRLSLLGGLLLGGSGLLGSSRSTLLLSALSILAIGRGPESEVVPQELHDQSAVAVALLGQGVKLGNGVVEGLLGEVACTVGGVEDLVVENGEVQSETKADGVSGGEIGLGNFGSVLYGGDQQIAQSAVRKMQMPWAPYLVGVVSGSGSNLALLAGGELSEVTVVVTLPVNPRG